MEAEPREFDLQTLSVALGDLRDALMLISTALKDRFADEPSDVKDQAIALVERELTRIRKDKRDAF